MAIRYDILEKIDEGPWRVDQFGDCEVEDNSPDYPGWRIVPEMYGDVCEITICSGWYEQKAEGSWDDLPRIAQAMITALHAFEEALNASTP